MANRIPFKTLPRTVRKIKIGLMVREHQGFLLDDTLSLSEEDFDCLLEYLDGMNIHIKALQRKE